MEYLSYAKINLSLLVTGRRGDRHLLDSVTATLTLADKMRFEPSDRPSVTVVRGAAEPPDRTDNALLALTKVREITGQAFALTVEKNIPDRAGLGGSSSEAAGILRFARDCLGMPTKKAEEIARSIGADAAVMLKGGFSHMRGTGEQLDSITVRTPLYFVLLAGGTVSTREAFALADGEQSDKSADGNAALIAALEAGRRPEQRMLVNDLGKAAETLCPSIARYRKDLQNAGAYAVGMSGSGSCVFGLFGTREACEIAAAKLDAPFKTVCGVQNGW